MKPQSNVLTLLLCCQFLATFGLMVLVPVMPLYLEKLTTSTKASAIWASIALAAPAIGGLVTAPLVGRLADHWGHRNTLFVALAGFCLSLVLMSVAGNLVVFLVARVLLGFCGISVAITAYTSHAVYSMGGASAKGIALGRLQSAMAAACLSGPLLGGLFMDAWGMELLLNLTAALTCIALIVAALLLREPPSAGAGDPHMPLPKRWYWQWCHLSWLSAGSLAQGGAFALVTCFALYLSERDPQPLTAATATGALHALAWAATFLAGSYWGRRNDQGQAPENFVLASAGCGVAVLMLIWADSLWLIALLRLIQGFFFAALIQSVMYSVSNQVAPVQQGQAIGTVKSALVTGQLIGPPTAASAYSLFQAAGAMAVTAGFFIAASLLLKAHQYSTRPEATQS
ncbi:MAG: MFS transporter [Alteromonadaceae bacterium]|nr:MFS transporter [Alteromonadaceae bacterium]